jgi:hypothetical protein
VPLNNLEKYAYLETAVKGMIGQAKDFEQKAKAIEIAMRFEILKLKAEPPKKAFGKGFEEDPGGEDDFKVG